MTSCAVCRRPLRNPASIKVGMGPVCRANGLIYKKECDMFSQADYEVKVVDGVLVIFDLDLGNKSVTNDIENVLADLAAKVELGNRPIIYRDSTGTFDGVNQECGRFIGFYSLGAENMYGAVRRVQALQRQAG